MAHNQHVTENYGHPWDHREGFDLLEMISDTQAELDQALAAAESAFWHVWINGQGNDGRPGAVLYKPSGLMKPWYDSPDHPFVENAVVTDLGNPASRPDRAQYRT